MIESLGMIAKATWLVIAIATGFMSICIMSIMGFTLMVDAIENLSKSVQNSRSR